MSRLGDYWVTMGLGPQEQQPLYLGINFELYSGRQKIQRLNLPVNVKENDVCPWVQVVA